MLLLAPIVLSTANTWDQTIGELGRWRRSMLPPPANFLVGLQEYCDRKGEAYAKQDEETK